MHAIQRGIQIQHNPYQNSNGIFHRNRKKNPKIHMESQKTPTSQSNLEEEEQDGRITLPDFKLCCKGIKILL